MSETSKIQEQANAKYLRRAREVVCAMINNDKGDNPELLQLKNKIIVEIDSANCETKNVSKMMLQLFEMSGMADGKLIYMGRTGSYTIDSKMLETSEMP